MRLRSCFNVIALSLGVFVSHTGLAADPVPAPHPQVELNTSMGQIVLELYPEAAPKTVRNFLQYVKSGFYNGTIFHRVIDNFMIQGGGLDKNLKEKKGNAPIPLEAQMAIDHGLKNEIGTIAMAREEKPNTATSEFFINVANNDFLDPATLPDGDPVSFMRRGTLRTMPRAQALLIAAGYAPFGRVIDGMAVVNQIKVLQTSAHGENANVPNTTVTVISAKILKTPITPKTIDEQLGIKPAETVAPEATPATNPEPAVPAMPAQAAQPADPATAPEKQDPAKSN
jgi:cyclophilin family peptidyl-prolyl cis-trans isomerase